MVGMPFWENEAPSDPKRPSARSSTFKLWSRSSARSSRRTTAANPSPVHSGTLNKAREVGRSDHIEVDIQRDVPTHLLGQGCHMVAGADEAALLCAPECEAHATARLGR